MTNTEYKNIPRYVKQSISSSYIAFGKKHGFDPSEWLDYFNDKAKTGRRASVKAWIGGNKRLATDFLISITERYLKIPPKKWEKYQDYLNSEEWKEVKEKYLKKGAKCLKCRKTKKLILHHLRYKDENGESILGRETQDDLVVLCWDCHTELHNKYGRGASFGMEEILEEEEDYIVILKSGRKLWIDADAFLTCKDALVCDEKYIPFEDAVIFVSEIEIILRESAYERSERKTMEELA